MQTHLLLSVSSQDKPGVIESISSCIQSCNASWLESRLAHLSGKFVGVIRIRLDESKSSNLKLSLQKLEEQGIYVSVEKPKDNNTATETVKTAKFSAIGPDRTGIVKEIASAFARKGINIEELETNLSSMPYSGEPIFEAIGLLSLPADINIKQLMDKMDAIANDLGINLDLD